MITLGKRIVVETQTIDQLLIQWEGLSPEEATLGDIS